MEIVELNAVKRDLSLKSRDVRLGHQIPAIYYGYGQENIPLTLNYTEFRNVFRKAGKNTIIKLKIDGNQIFNVLVHDIQRDPVRDTFSHIDFMNVRMDRAIHAKVPLKFVGDAPVVKDSGGILTIQREEVEVKCLPDKLPQLFELDVSVIKDFSTSLRVKDIKAPEGVTILDDPEITLMTAISPKEEVEEAPVAAAPVEGEAAVGAVPAEGEPGAPVAVAASAAEKKAEK